MKILKLYYIDDEYIDFLRKHDAKVPYNKSQTRPFIGVVYRLNGNIFFAPLSSPKPKHIKMNEKAMDIFKIDKGKLGIVNINNMLPAPIQCLTEVLPQIEEQRYRILLTNQITFLNNHKRALLTKVKQFQNVYRKGLLPDSIKERCCDFNLLEEKCIAYMKAHDLDKNKDDLEDINS